MGLRDFQQIVYLAHPGNITFVPWISSFLSSHCSYDPLWTRLSGCVFVYLCFCVCLEESNWRNNLVRIFSPNSPKLLPTGPSGQGCHQIVGCRHYLLLKTCSPSTFSVFLPITVQILPNAFPNDLQKKNDIGPVHLSWSLLRSNANLNTLLYKVIATNMVKFHFQFPRECGKSYFWEECGKL